MKPQAVTNAFARILLLAALCCFVAEFGGGCEVKTRVEVPGV